jgi:hypothetical protein
MSSESSESWEIWRVEQLLSRDSGMIWCGRDSVTPFQSPRCGSTHAPQDGKGADLPSPAGLWTLADACTMMQEIK